MHGPSRIIMTNSNKKSVAPSGTKSTIFIVYYPEESGKALVELFGGLGYDVALINNLDSLLATSAENVSGALVDISVGGKSAIHAIEIVNQMPSGNLIPVLVSCEFPDVELIVDALNAGAVDYIVRPYSKLELVQRMRSIIGAVR